ncbi:hypothetical protein JCM21900_005272 [Sporobolomyces salmonicolor]
MSGSSSPCHLSACASSVSTPVDSSNDSTLPPIDPRDDVVLPPWIWLTLCTLSLFCLLFISFRRAKSLELYERARDYLRSKLPFSLDGGIRLTERDLEEAAPSSCWSRSRSRSRSRRPLPPSPSDADSDSDTSSIHARSRSPSSSDADDELPASAPSLRTASLQSARRKGWSMVGSAGEGLKHGAASFLETFARDARGRGPAGGGAGGREKDTRGIASAGGGGTTPAAAAAAATRRQDRAGGVRLGESTPGEEEGEANELGGLGGVRARVTDLEGGQRRDRRGASAAALFEVGEQDDAVELPAHFELGEPVDRAGPRAKQRW